MQSPTTVCQRLTIAAALVFPTIVQAQSHVSVDASRDNTLYENAGGSVSNGAGSYLFTGRTGAGDVRRALIAFDLDNVVPQGAAVDSVRLIVTMSKTTSSAKSISVHKVLLNWGEAGSNANQQEGQGAPAVDGDATWLHTFFPGDSWNSPGGDFDDTPSATISVAATGSYTFGPTELLTEDVRDWMESPDLNFGWMLVGDESTAKTSKRFNSRENANVSSRPKLEIFYSIPTRTEPESVPTASRLLRPYPNPFRERTRIAYELDASENVILDGFDVLGRRVESLVSARQAAGRHEVVFDAAGFSPGIYIYRLTTTGVVRTGTLLLVR